MAQLSEEKIKQNLAAEAGEVRPRVGSAGLCVKEGGVKGDEVLMIFSNKYEEWVLPGGGVKFGASIADTIIREMKEETGVDVTYSHVLDIVEIIKPEQANHRIIVYSQVNYAGGELKAGDDAGEARFFNRAGLADIYAAGQLTGVSVGLLQKTGWLDVKAAAA